MDPMSTKSTKSTKSTMTVTTSTMTVTTTTTTMTVTTTTMKRRTTTTEEEEDGDQALQRSTEEYRTEPNAVRFCSVRRRAVQNRTSLCSVLFCTLFSGLPA